MRRTIRPTLILSLCALAGWSQAVTDPEVNVMRFVHACPGVVAIDVYLDDKRLVSGLKFGAATRYLNTATNDNQLHVLRVTASGGGELGRDEKVFTRRGSPYDFYLMGTAKAPRLGSTVGHMNGPGNERLSFFNASDRPIPLAFSVLNKGDRSPDRYPSRALEPGSQVSASIFNTPATIQATLPGFQKTTAQSGQAITLVVLPTGGGGLRTLVLDGARAPR